MDKSLGGKMRNLIQSEYDEGWNARMNGKARAANPYPQSLSAWFHWLSGWDGANMALLATMTQEPTIDGD